MIIPALEEVMKNIKNENIKIDIFKQTEKYIAEKKKDAPEKVKKIFFH